jgi:hypothetical protein
MTSDEQEYSSIRYSYAPLLFVPLRSGRIAIGRGYNPFELLHIAEDWHEIPEYISGYSEACAAEYALRRESSARIPPPDDLDIELDFSNLRL